MVDARKLPDLERELRERLEAISKNLQAPQSDKTIDARSQLNEIASGVDKIRADMEEARIERWKAMVGTNTDMLLSAEAAVTYFEHPDPRVRVAAISIGSQRWPKDPQVAAGCERLALHDQDHNVRSVSLFSMGACYEGSHNERVSRVLATVVANGDNDDDLRRSAYAGLLTVQGVDLLLHDPSFERPQSFPIPDGIDWLLVRRVLG